jgi:hypothetical protein
VKTSRQGESGERDGQDRQGHAVCSAAMTASNLMERIHAVLKNKIETPHPVRDHVATLITFLICYQPDKLVQPHRCGTITVSQNLGCLAQT